MPFVVAIVIFVSVVQEPWPLFLSLIAGNLDLG